MTCYFRHLDEVFAKAGIQVTKENRKQLSSILKSITREADCPAVWQKIKKRLVEDENGFISELRKAWESRAPR